MSSRQSAWASDTAQIPNSTEWTGGASTSPPQTRTHPASETNNIQIQKITIAFRFTSHQIHYSICIGVIKQLPVSPVRFRCIWPACAGASIPRMPAPCQWTRQWSSASGPRSDAQDCRRSKCQWPNQVRKSKGIRVAFAFLVLNGIKSQDTWRMRCCKTKGGTGHS